MSKYCNIKPNDSCDAGRLKNTYLKSMNKNYWCYLELLKFRYYQNLAGLSRKTTTIEPLVIPFPVVKQGFQI